MYVQLASAAWDGTIAIWRLPADTSRTAPADQKKRKVDAPAAATMVRRLTSVASLMQSFFFCLSPFVVSIGICDSARTYTGRNWGHLGAAASDHLGLVGPHHQAVGCRDRGCHFHTGESLHENLCVVMLSVRDNVRCLKHVRARVCECECECECMVCTWYDCPLITSADRKQSNQRCRLLGAYRACCSRAPQ